jgi:class 3 adenylate cyclase/ActR/RegA family two-component response regulator
MTALPAGTATSRSERKRVLVVDDSFIMRHLVKEIVDSDPDLEVVGTAENGRVAMQKVRQLNPDAVLLDIAMAEMSGLETLRRLGLRSACKVIILSSLVASADSAERIEALRLGAAAAIGKPSGGVSLDLKQKRASQVVSTLRHVLGLPAVVDLPGAASGVSTTPDLTSGAFAEHLLAGLETAVLLFDDGGRLVRGNAAAGRILRGCDVTPRRATIGSICDEYNQALRDETWNVIGGADALGPKDTDFASRDGDWMPVRRTIRPVEMRGGRRGALLLLDDITEKRRMQSLLDKTMPSGIAGTMIAAPARALGGELREVTILFADIRGFTPLAEALGARAIVDLLNQYFSYMADVIGAEGGVIDKFVGDGLMALFGVPASHGDDADRAVAAARNMQRALRLLNERCTTPALRIGIGLGTGPVVAGQIGSPDRMNYTVIGDAANLAARIEGMTKTYGSDILICEETFGRLRRPVPSRKIDVVTVKGREAPTTIYQVFVEEPGAGAAAWLTQFGSGVAAYLDGDFAAAQQHLARAAAANPNDLVARLLTQRCHRLGLLKPGEWTGAWKLTEK